MKRKSCYSSLKNVGARFVKGSPVTLWKENRNSAHNSSSAQLSSARILIKKSLCLDASEEAPQEIRELPIANCQLPMGLDVGLGKIVRLRWHFSPKKL